MPTGSCSPGCCSPPPPSATASVAKARCRRAWSSSALGSLLGVFADTSSLLIVSRAIMGVGAAFVMPSTLSILANVFPARERAKAIAIWAGISGAGAAIGPVASGLLLEHFWYGSVFLVNLPIIAGALVAGYILVPKSKDAGETPLDPVGAVLSIFGLGALVYAIIEGPAPRLAQRRVGAVVRRCGHLPAGLRPVGMAQPSSDARPAAVPEPAVRRLVGRHHVGLLRHVRFVLHARPVLPGRHRLEPARRRPAPAAVLGGDDGDRPEHSQARRPARRQQGRSARPQLCRHRDDRHPAVLRRRHPLLGDAHGHLLPRRRDGDDDDADDDPVDGRRSTRPCGHGFGDERHDPGTRWRPRRGRTRFAAHRSVRQWCRHGSRRSRPPPSARRPKVDWVV